MEKKLRAKLEEELNESRKGNELMQNVTESNENFDQLRHKLSDYEEKVTKKSHKTHFPSRINFY